MSISVIGVGTLKPRLSQKVRQRLVEEEKKKTKQEIAKENFAPDKRKRMTMKEHKFMAVLSQTCNLREAFRAVYKVGDFEDKKMEDNYVSAQANKVLNRIKKKAPEYAAAMTFEDITPDFVRKATLKLYNKAIEAEDRNIEARAVEMMAKFNAMFKEDVTVKSKIEGTVKNIYKETDDDMPDFGNNKIGRDEFNSKFIEKDIPKA